MLTPSPQHPSTHQSHHRAAAALPALSPPHVPSHWDLVWSRQDRSSHQEPSARPYKQQMDAISQDSPADAAASEHPWVQLRTPTGCPPCPRRSQHHPRPLPSKDTGSKRPNCSSTLTKRTKTTSTAIISRPSRFMVGVSHGPTPSHPLPTAVLEPPHPSAVAIGPGIPRDPCRCPRGGTGCHPSTRGHHISGGRARGQVQELTAESPSGAGPCP